MSEHYPRIRIRTEGGHLLIREGLSINFYMRRSHAEVAPAVMRSLDAYLRAMEPRALGLYAAEGEWRELDDEGWASTRRRILDGTSAIVDLRDASGSENRYRVEYYGRPLDAPSWGERPGMVCALSFWLPTEYLEEHGPARLCELVLELADPLPFSSGHAGLSFNCETDVVGVTQEIRHRSFRYPGLDIPNLSRFSRYLGTRVRGPSWMTFLGQPVLGELGGVGGLRSRLHSPETTVRELEGERAVVTLGPWPEAGDTEQGQVLPAYRELARVLEPWLYHQKPLFNPHFTAEDVLRWERRFLD
ncbi:MAG TPA: DUF3396 domain-containing protein [Archangium sp.]|jgi:hypothetical protein|uniref:DUF3396 domain-containing protein n=1 Tax=Archangium sp. TaxID=1872627 RepID=UPI002EDB17F0